MNCITRVKVLLCMCSDSGNIHCLVQLERARPLTPRVAWCCRYNCEDAGCYYDLSRLRGIKYMTWEKQHKLVQQDEVRTQHLRFSLFSACWSNFGQLELGRYCFAVLLLVVDVKRISHGTRKLTESVCSVTFP